MFYFSDLFYIRDVNYWEFLANTTLDITDVNATATNYLAIIVTTTATSNRVWGGSVTIALQ